MKKNYNLSSTHSEEGILGNKWKICTCKNSNIHKSKAGKILVFCSASVFNYVFVSINLPHAEIRRHGHEAGHRAEHGAEHGADQNVRAGNEATHGAAAGHVAGNRTVIENGLEVW